MAGSASNTQSTSYAVQGLVAVGAAPGTVSRALAYIRGLQRADGSVSYSRSSTQTPVWVTAQALLAFRRAPLPVATAALRPRAKHGRAGGLGRVRRAGRRRRGGGARGQAGKAGGEAVGPGEGRRRARARPPQPRPSARQGLGTTPAAPPG